jgi:hypothetical protein
MCWTPAAASRVSQQCAELLAGFPLYPDVELS